MYLTEFLMCFIGNLVFLFFSVYYFFFMCFIKKRTSNSLKSTLKKPKHFSPIASDYFLYYVLTTCCLTPSNCRL